MSSVEVLHINIYYIFMLVLSSFIKQLIFHSVNYQMIQLAASPTTSTMRHVHNIHSFMCYLIYLFVLSSPHNGNYGFIALLSVTDQDTGLLTVPCRDHWIKSRFGLAISGLPPVHPAVTTGSQRRLGVVLATSPHCVS